MNFISYYISLIPIIIFIIEIIIQIGLPKKVAPLVILIIGMISGIFYLSPNNIYNGILLGILLSSSCIGFYSGIKNVFEYFNKITKSYRRKE